jgi:anti-sigma factor RsiW
MNTTSMRCQEFLERLVEATTGSTSPAERAGLAEHLATCLTCRAEAAAIEATTTLLHERGAVPAPPGFWADFNARLAARLADEPRARHLPRGWALRRRPAWGAVAVTAAAAVAIAAVVKVGPMRPPTDPTTARARGLVTPAMATTVPSLDDLLKTWRDGLNPETLVPN